MEKENINSMIATVMQTNGMLGLIDKYRNDEKVTLKEIQDEWNKLYSMDAKQHYFLNQYQYLTSLLSFIVIPKENMFDELPDLKISELSDKWGIKDKGEFKFKYFIRRMRNSISHGGIVVSEKMEFCFNDVNPKDHKDVFECILHESELRKFVHAFAFWVMSNELE